MDSVIKVGLFDLIFEKTDNFREALVYLESNDRIYYKAVSDFTKSLFYLFDDTNVTKSFKPPYDMRLFNKYKRVKLEIHIDPEIRVDVSNRELYCVKVAGSQNVSWKALIKSCYIGDSVLSMFISMVHAVFEGNWKGYYWACSVSKDVNRDDVKLSGVCSEDTVKLYLNNLVWPYGGGTSITCNMYRIRS